MLVKDQINLQLIENYLYNAVKFGDVVELVDTLGLEPSAERCGGSTPSIPTISLVIF